MYDRTYYVYIATNKHNRVLYIGFTNDLNRRMYEHQTKRNKDSFTANYHVNKLVYFEEYTDVYEGIAREKQLKNWHRSWKINLIKEVNPQWKNLMDLDTGDPETSSG